jgi:hypothetical protein
MVRGSRLAFPLTDATTRSQKGARYFPTTSLEKIERWKTIIGTKEA